MLQQLHLSRLKHVQDQQDKIRVPRDRKNPPSPSPSRRCAADNPRKIQNLDVRSVETNLFRMVDLPTLGSPMRTTVASPPLRISKAGPPPFEVELSSSSCNRASLALRRPMWCSVFLLIWVFFISSSICLIFSGRPNLLYLWFPVHLRPDIVNLASR